MGITGASNTASNGASAQQVELSMLTAALGQQSSAIESINAATQSADLSFMGIGQNINVLA